MINYNGKELWKKNAHLCISESHCCTAESNRDFPGGPVAMTPAPDAGGQGLIPGLRTEMPHATAKSLHAAT